MQLKEGERREVCILFADVHGFTALSERLDHEVIHLLLDKLMQLFTARIKHYGGYIDKYDGDQVMALFGAKVASEQDTERAIEAALQMLSVLDQFNDAIAKRFGPDTRLGIRIGINTGEVTTGRVGEKREGDFTVYGDVVNLASRMETNAPINRIMLPKATMLRVESAFDFEPSGKITVKGKVQPVEVYLVQGLKAEKLYRWQLRQIAFVGRESEMAQLLAKYEEVKERLERDGKGKRKSGMRDVVTEETQYIKPTSSSLKPIVVGLKGEAGMGKSRLVDEFIRSQDVTSFYLHGETPLMTLQSYGLFTAMIKRYLGITPLDNNVEALNKLESGLNDLESFLETDESKCRLKDSLPQLSHLLGLPVIDEGANLTSFLKLPPKELQPHFQTAIRLFIEAFAAKANISGFPLVIALEDLHWSDDPSLMTLDFLLFTLNLDAKRQGTAHKQILFLLTYRPEFTPSRGVMVDSAFEEIDLSLLTHESSRSLIASIMAKNSLTPAPSSIPEETLSLALAKSEGNPLFVEEWANLIAESPELTVGGKFVVPRTLQALIQARLDQLETDVKRLLQNAAVLGREFLSQLLYGMEQKLQKPQEVFDKLSMLVARRMVLPLSKQRFSAYMFKHIITRDITYNTLLLANRKALHRIAGEVIEETFTYRLDEYWRDLAEHFEKAEVWDKAVDYLLKAADQAKDRYDNSEALRFYDKLLLLFESHPELVDLKTTVHAMLGKGAVLELIGKWAEAEKLYQQALECIEPSQEKSMIARTITSLGNIWQLRGNYDRALECFEKSISIAEGLGNKQAISDITIKLGVVFEKRGDFDRALEYYQKSLSNAEESENKRGKLIALLHIGNVFIFRGDYDRVLDCYQKCLSIAEELGHKQGISSANLGMGNVLVFRGDFDQGLKCYERSLSIAEELGDKRGISYAVGNMGSLCDDSGEFDRALEFHRRKLSLAEELGDRRGMSRALGNMGGVYFNLNDYANAKEHLEQAINLSRDVTAKDHLCYFMLITIRLYIKLNSYPEARDYCREAWDLADQIKSDDYILQAEILSHKIDFLTAEDDTTRVAALAALNTLLEQTTDEEHCADMHYELTGMHRIMSHSDQTELHRQQAISLYKKLYTRKPDYDFKRRLKELEEEVTEA